MLQKITPAHNRGFNLLEMTVSIGLGAFLILILAYFSQDMITTFSRLEKSRSITDLVTEVQVTFTNSEQCSLNLKNLTLNSEVSRLDIFDLKSKSPGTQIVVKGQKMSGLSIEKISLIQGAKVDTNLVIGGLSIAYRPNTKPQELEYRFIPLMTRLQDGKISECWVRGKQIETDISQVCAVMTKGAATYFDVNERKCTVPGAKWFVGTSSQAVCPSGYQLPKVVHAAFDCDVISDNLVDTFPKTKVTLSDGSTLELSRPPYLTAVDPAGKKCLCDWALDIPTSQVNTFKCKILCVPSET